MYVNKKSFTPSPKVDSKIVLLTKKSDEKYDQQFYQFMKKFFLAKRKKISNNLPSFINKKEWSVTSLETYPDCPYKYYLNKENLVFFQIKTLE